MAGRRGGLWMQRVRMHEDRPIRGQHTEPLGSLQQKRPQPNLRQRITPKSKYSAQRCVLDGIKFPSRREMRRYAHLKLQQQVGRIVDLVLQPRFPIVLQRHIHLAAPLQANGQPAPVYFDGRSALELGLVTVAEYRADFTYYDASTGEFIVEDAKGFKTDIYKLKKRLIEAQYGFVIREV